MSEAPYFKNHDRRARFPWSLYHGELARRLARVIATQGPSPRVLIVGCGLEPFIDGAPSGTQFFGCDLDPRAVQSCKQLFPHMAERMAVCPSPLELPTEANFQVPFDVVLAKEVVEHLEAPVPWVQTIATRVRPGGELVLTTPNYGAFSTLPWIEATVLEAFARWDGYSRRHIHPSKFSRHRLTQLDVGPGLVLREIQVSYTGWTLIGRWVREQ